MIVGAIAAVAAAAWVVAPLIGPARADAKAGCPNCGPRPEADARFCSNCGAEIAR